MLPENSRKDRDSQTFFAHIPSQIYAYNECQHFIIAGDFISRKGGLSDIVNEIDNILETKIN
jgi:hypothetical protein